jgi:hypothetical protein
MWFPFTVGGLLVWVALVELGEQAALLDELAVVAITKLQIKQPGITLEGVGLFQCSQLSLSRVTSALASSSGEQKSAVVSGMSGLSCMWWWSF